MSEILPGQLWVGSRAAARDLLALGDARITHVLNCTNQLGAHDSSSGHSADTPRCLSLGLLDSTADLPRMPAVFASGLHFIHDAIQSGGCVLVHCHSGISRSCTLAIAYIMWAHNRTAEAAFEDVHRARHVCNPNLGYMICLSEWEKQMSSCSALPPMPKP